MPPPASGLRYSRIGRFVRFPHALRWLAADWLRTRLTAPASLWLYVGYLLCRAAGLSRVSLDCLMAANRASNGRRFVDSVRRRLPDILVHMPELLHPPSGAPDEALALRRCIILRLPDAQSPPRWRGVILLSFTDTFARLHHDYNLTRLAADFHIVLEPSWAGYCVPSILLWCAVREPILVQSSESRDRHFLRSLRSNLLPIECGAGDWVDPLLFWPTPDATKDYDVLYVANALPYKRVHVFLRAVRDAANLRPGFKAALVLDTWRGNGGIVEELIGYYAIGDAVEILRDLRVDDMRDVYCRSKSCVLVSLREGSNRSLFESMFCDTPVLLIAENVGVNKSHVNDSTGRIVPEALLPQAMLDMSSSYASYSARRWALANIAPAVTTARLALALRQSFPDEPLDDSDLYVKTNNPEVAYWASGAPTPTLDLRGELARYRRSPCATPA